MLMSNKVYDILNKIERWLPALGVFYLALTKIWGLPLGNEINATIMAVATLLASTLEISTARYNQTIKAETFEDFGGTD
ncbi:MAG: hypothetical protein IKF49_04405 [Clostridia bacterium]|nr:hypothetical protein [Clostridia bacterium]